MAHTKSGKHLHEDISDVIDHAFSRKALLSVSKRTLAPLLTYMITEHASDGEFLGGPRANRGYSETTLPAWFFGEVHKTGGEWQISSTKFNTTVYPGDDLIWRSAGGQLGLGLATQSGEPSANPFLIGGYKRFRDLAGRQTAFVDLTFTGAMLRSVETSARLSTRGVRLETGATGGQQDKATFTDAQREWLGLFPEERRKVMDELTDFIERRLDE